MFDAIRILQLSWVNGVSLFFSLSGDPFVHQFQISKNLIQGKNIRNFRTENSKIFHIITISYNQHIATDLS